EEGHTLLLELALQRIDVVVVVDDLLGELEVSLAQRRDCAGCGRGDECAHRHQVVADLLQLLLENPAHVRPLFRATESRSRLALPTVTNQYRVNTPCRAGEQRSPPRVPAPPAPERVVRCPAWTGWWCSAPSSARPSAPDSRSRCTGAGPG